MAPQPLICGGEGGKDDPVLRDHLAGSVATCRRLRTALSLLLVEIDGYEDLAAKHGPQATDRLVSGIGESSAELCGEDLVCLQLGDRRLALIFEDCDRHQAVAAARCLVAGVRQRRDSIAMVGRPNVTLSGGVATVVVPARNFPPVDLIEAAERCLAAAQSSGGDAVKSIDIY